jgi:hypothetical protein
MLPFANIGEAKPISVRTQSLDSYHNAVPIKHNVEPTYIGFSNTLKGNEVTLVFIKIPQ